MGDNEKGAVLGSDVGDRDGPCDGNTMGDGLKGDDEGAMVGY